MRGCFFYKYASTLLFKIPTFFPSSKIFLNSTFQRDHSSVFSIYLNPFLASSMSLFSDKLYFPRVSPCVTLNPVTPILLTLLHLKSPRRSKGNKLFNFQEILQISNHCLFLIKKIFIYFQFLYVVICIYIFTLFSEIPNLYQNYPLTPSRDPFRVHQQTCKFLILPFCISKIISIAPKVYLSRKSPIQGDNLQDSCPHHHSLKAINNTEGLCIQKGSVLTYSGA